MIAGQSELEIAGLPATEIPSHKLPTNTTTRNSPVHRWINFTAGFSPELVRNIIQRERIIRGTVLDPFSGMATTAVESNLLGIDAIGYEPHPHAAMMGLAKTTFVQPERIVEIEKIIKSASSTSDPEGNWNTTQLTYLRKLVDEDKLVLLCDLANKEHLVSPDIRPLYRLIVTKLLEGASGAATDGIYKAPSTKKKSRDLFLMADQTLSEIRSDLVRIGSNHGKSKFYFHSSENMSEVADNSISCIITSPPYLNNFDFAEMSRMEIYFWNYADSWKSITEKVRRNLVINTTTAPSDLRSDQERWENQLSERINKLCSNIVDELQKEQLSRNRPKDYKKLVRPYFAQMKNILQESYRALEQGRTIDLIVADAALYGVHIHTESILAEIMDEIGFEIEDIIRLRSRGDRWKLDKRTGSKTPLGEFQIIGRKA